MVRREDVLDTTFGDDDVWIATHWKTAHPIDVAVTAGVIGRERVVYLVQDYEPGFSPWSTEYAVAASTYRAGFRMLVNSEPLRRYLAEVEALDVPRERTFAPHLDLELLDRVADARRHEDVVRVLFYGRPSKHRNLFRLGSRRSGWRSRSSPPTVCASSSTRRASSTATSSSTAVAAT